MKCDSAIKKERFLSVVVEWLRPEDIMLSEIIQSQKDKVAMLPLMDGRQKGYLKQKVPQ